MCLLNSSAKVPDCFVALLRAKQISSSTGVALPYKVEWAYKCFNGEIVEREVHHKLEDYRVNNQKEFFQISLEEAKQAITLVGNKFK